MLAKITNNFKKMGDEMGIFNSLTIQKRLLIMLLVAVVVSTTVVAWIGSNGARTVLAERLQETDLPNLVLRIRNALDKEINQMKTVTRGIAENEFVLDWIDSGADKAGEAKLIKYLGKLAQSKWLE